MQWDSGSIAYHLYRCDEHRSIKVTPLLRIITVQIQIQIQEEKPILIEIQLQAQKSK